MDNVDLSSAFNSGPEKEPKAERQEQAQDFSPEISKMAKCVIKCSGGLIKSGRMANVVLLILVLIMFAVSSVLIYSQIAPKAKIPSSELINMPANNLPR